MTAAPTAPPPVVGPAPRMPSGAAPVAVTGPGDHRCMQADSLMFSAIVQAATSEARRLGLSVPAFRSPPSLPGRDRTIASRQGQVVVAVRLRDRPACDIAADVIEGILVAGGVHLEDVAGSLGPRRALISAVEAALTPVV
jgi:hypothetical protein